MRILVVSDSHKINVNMERVIKEKGPFDRLIHLGDCQMSEGEVYALAGCPVDVVKGNCDCNPFLPSEKIVEIGKYKFLLIHGHTKAVKYNLDRLMYYGLEKNVDVVLFGHTHMPLNLQADGIKIINPGSISVPRQPSRKPSWLVLEVDDEGEINYKFDYFG